MAQEQRKKQPDWEMAFYNLADLYAEADAMLLFLGGKAKLKRGQIVQLYQKLTEEQQENLRTQARLNVVRIRDGTYGKPEPKDTLNVIDKRKFQRSEEMNKLIQSRRKALKVAAYNEIEVE